MPQMPRKSLKSAFPCPSQDLARLSLSDPEYLAVHSEAASATPLKLDQAYAQVRGGGRVGGQGGWASATPLKLARLCQTGVVANWC